MDINESKKYIKMQIDELSGLADVDLQHIQKFRAFITDLSFERGQITFKNYYANLGDLKSSYRTYLK